MFKVSFNIFALEIICQRIFNKKGILRNLHSIETKHSQGLVMSNYTVVSYALKLSHAQSQKFLNSTNQSTKKWYHRNYV